MSTSGRSRLLGLPDDPAAVTLDDPARHDAIRRFLTRAREARPGMSVDRHPMKHVVSLCVALDGLPLALERARPAPIVGYVDGLLDRGDDLEGLVRRRH